MNYLNELIDKAKDEQKVIGICIRKLDWNKRHIGYIEKYQPKKELVINELNEYGKVIGRKTILFENIQSVEFGGVYNDSLENAYKSGIWQKKSTTRYIRNISSESVNKRLRNILEQKIICTFYADDNYTTGFLQDISENLLLIKNISFNGVDDGFTAYYLKSLTRVRYNGPIENKIAMLYNKTDKSPDDTSKPK